MSLEEILEERGFNEEVEFCIDTDYFGFGSLEALREAHENKYR